MSTFNVRIFGYAGLRQIEQLMPKQFTSDTVFVPDEPCLWSQLLVVDSGGAAVVSAVVAAVPDKTTIVCVEVPDGKQIRYEVQPQGPLGGGARAAGNLSRRMSGFSNLAWNPGYTLSVCDASAFL